MIRCYSYVYTTSPSVNNMEISVDLTLFPKKLGQLRCYCKKNEYLCRQIKKRNSVTDYDDIAQITPSDHRAFAKRGYHSCLAGPAVCPFVYLFRGSAHRPLRCRQDASAHHRLWRLCLLATVPV